MRIIKKLINKVIAFKASVNNILIKFISINKISISVLRREGKSHPLSGGCGVLAPISLPTPNSWRVGVREGFGWIFMTPQRGLRIFGWGLGIPSNNFSLHNITCLCLYFQGYFLSRNFIIYLFFLRVFSSNISVSTNHSNSIFEVFWLKIAQFQYIVLFVRGQRVNFIFNFYTTTC